MGFQNCTRSATKPGYYLGWPEATSRVVAAPVSVQSIPHKRNDKRRLRGQTISTMSRGSCAESHRVFRESRIDRNASIARKGFPPQGWAIFPRRGLAKKQITNRVSGYPRSVTSTFSASATARVKRTAAQSRSTRHEQKAASHRLKSLSHKDSETRNIAASTRLTTVSTCMYSTCTYPP